MVTKKSSKLRTVEFIIALVCILLIEMILADVCVSLLYHLTGNIIFSKTYLKKQLLQSNQKDTGTLPVSPDISSPDWMIGEVLHPYLGYVRDPKDAGVNTLGWLGENPVGKRDKYTVRIAIFGGSVANNLYKYSKDTLVNELARLPLFRGKSVRVYSIALAGYKQPQQLMALSYLLSIGAEFDVVINLDGFNEVFLSYADNWKNGVAISYPMAWNYYAKTTLDETASRQISIIQRLREHDRLLTEIFSIFPLRNNSVFLLVWHFLRSQGTARYYTASETLKRSVLGVSDSYRELGPGSGAPSVSDALTYAADVWMNASMQMAALSTGGNTRYIHFLQPNQYVPGSKTFSNEEWSNSFIKADRTDNTEFSYTYNHIIREGYPLLQQRGSRLTSMGIHFVDLTQLFKAERETIYIDACCHVNKQGNDLLAKEIARYISKLY